MRMTDGVRQIVAGVLAAAVFLGLFQGLLLQWYLALGLGVAVYGAFLMLIGRRMPLEEIVLSDRVSAADIAKAGDALREAAARVGRAAALLTGADRATLTGLQGHLDSIREQIMADPADYRSAQRFITSYLTNMVSNIEAYVHLAKRAAGDERLAGLRQGIIGYGQVVARIDKACLENDFTALEGEVDALAFQLKRG